MIFPYAPLLLINSIEIIMGVKDLIEREFNGDPNLRRSNIELLRSAAIFFGSVVFMRAFGELMAV